MRVSSLLGALLVLLCCSAGSTWGGTCDFTFPSGHYYNLNALAELHPQDKPASVTVQYNGGTETYLWAPCNIIPETVCSGPTTLPNAAMCQQGSSSHNIGVGPTPTWTEVSTSPPSFKLEWDNGDDKRSSQITITCEPSGGPDSGLQADEDSNGNPEHPPLHYNLKWSSSASWACPQSSPPTPSNHDGGSGGLSGGWIFIIVLFSLVILYFIGGVLWQKFKVQAQGIELIPNVRFWLALPGLVKDGILYTYRKAMGLCNRGATYETV